MSTDETITLSGRYQYHPEQDVLGRGGFADVVKARDLLLGREVALKLLDPRIVDQEPAFAEQFKREAGEVSRLDHVNIVTIHDFGLEGSQLFLVMSYLPGGDLSRKLALHGPYTLDEALAILEPVALALDYAHGRGLVHRDVKPHNILFAEDGRPVLTDFGLAKLIGGSRTAATMMMSGGGPLGTAEYMAPEQALGKPVSPATDVYALAVTLFQMLTGDVPFRGESWMSTLFQATNTPRETLDGKLPQGLSREVRAVLLDGMAIEPGVRPQSGPELTGLLSTDLCKMSVTDGDCPTLPDYGRNSDESRDRSHTVTRMSKFDWLRATRERLRDQSWEAHSALELRFRGESHRCDGNYEAAIADMSDSLKLEPDNAFALRSRGAAYRQLGKFDKSLADLTRSLEIEPDNAWALGNRGETYRLIGRYDEALADLNESLVIEPDEPTALLCRAAIYYDIGMVDSALVDLHASLKLDQDNALALSVRGAAFLEKGKYEAALADLNAALKLEPDSAFALDARRRTLQALGRTG